MLSPRHDPVVPEFDPAMPNGGNPDITNVNAQYAGLEFHYIFLMVSLCPRSMYALAHTY